jgi:hypothetical protein
MATTKQCQWTLFLATALTSLQVLPTIPASSFSSSSILVSFFYVVLGGLNSKLISLWHENASSVCLTHFHFCSLICTATCFFCPCLNNSSFEIMLNQDILKCLHVLCDSLGTLPCFTPILDITCTSKRPQLCCSVYLPSLSHSIKSNKSCIGLLNPYFLSSSAPPMLITTLP